MSRQIAIGFTGYACNGKSSIIKALQQLIETTLNIPCFLIEEPVKEVKDTLTKEEFKNDNIRQKAILSVAKTQLNLIKEIKSRFYLMKRDCIILTDRTLLDVYAFSEMLPEVDISITEDDIMDVVETYNKIYYVNKPSSIEVLNKCFNKEVRKATIDKDKYFEYESIFKNIIRSYIEQEFLIFADDFFTEIKASSDNTYVIYDILADIREMLV